MTTTIDEADSRIPTHQLTPQPATFGCRKTAAWGCGSIAVLIIVIVLGLGLLAETQLIPSTKAVKGHELRQATIQQLVDHGVLEADETVQYFYSVGFISYLEDGNLFTDRRVISYQSLDSDEPYLDAATFDEIAGLDISYSESFLDDSLIEVTLKNGDSFYLYVSAEEKGDRKFFKALEEKWASEGSPPEVPEESESDQPASDSPQSPTSD